MQESFVFYWNFDPIALSIGSIRIHWYGICWTIAFLCAEFSVRRRLVSRGWGEIDITALVGFALIGTIAGARIAHCLFYDPSFYLAHPLKIFAIWEGGMASHGGTVGLIASLAFALPRYAPRMPLLVMLDATTFAAAFGGVLIRFANFLNSEIVGKPTSGEWGVVFERVDAIPRHPVQFYEAIAYLLVLLVLKVTAHRWAGRTPRGLLTGLFLSLVFGARLFIEFWKTPQAAYEAENWITVGQWLSVPYVLMGAVLVLSAISSMTKLGKH